MSFYNDKFAQGGFKNPPPMKRLVVCCDGTWQASNQGVQAVPSNVAKISRALAKHGNDGVDAKGPPVPQIVYYDAGVGTAMGWIEKRYAGGLGEGLSENVCEAYNFLANNYCPGDEVYFFGFSRGAFTVRATAGLVAQIGLCENSAMDQFWEMYTAYKQRKSEEKLRDTAWGKSEAGQDWLSKTQKGVNIVVVGVWDTVGSLGWPDFSWLNLPWTSKAYGFHNTEIHPDIKNAFHALALDERRAPFSPTLWTLPKHQKSTNLIQCWFPGVHINIGGGSDDGIKDRKGDLESMANTTFAWMVDRIQQYSNLEFDPLALHAIMRRYAHSLQELIKNAPEDVSGGEGKVHRGWGVGPIIDSFSGSQKLAGSAIRTPCQYAKAPNTLKTNEFIHPVVGHATDPALKTGYKPKALVDYERKAKGTNEGFEYVLRKDASASSWLWNYAFGKATKSPDGEQPTISIPEFKIPASPAPQKQSMERWLILRADRVGDDTQAGELQEVKSTSVRPTPARDFLRQLDKQHGIVGDYGEGQ